MMIFLLFFSLVHFSIQNENVTLYVSATGLKSGDCLSEETSCTFNYTLSKVDSDSSLHFKNGVYYIDEKYVTSFKLLYSIVLRGHYQTVVFTSDPAIEEIATENDPLFIFDGENGVSFTIENIRVNYTRRSFFGSGCGALVRPNKLVIKDTHFSYSEYQLFKKNKDFRYHFESIEFIGSHFSHNLHGFEIENEIDITLLVTNSSLHSNSNGAINLFSSAHVAIQVSGTRFYNNDAQDVPTYCACLCVELQKENKDLVMHIDQSSFSNNHATSVSLRISGTLNAELRGSQWTNNAGLYWGGAVFLNAGNVNLDIWNCLISQNFAQAKGGAFELNAQNAIINIHGSVFQNNSAWYSGGAFHINTYNFQGTIDQATFFRDNSAQNGAAYFVNAIVSYLRIEDSTFVGNSADNYAAGFLVFSQDITLQVLNARFEENSGAFGSGFYARAGREVTINIDGTHFVGNSASDRSAGFQVDYVMYKAGTVPNITINKCTFDSNRIRESTKAAGMVVHFYDETEQDLVCNEDKDSCFASLKDSVGVVSLEDDNRDVDLVLSNCIFLNHVNNSIVYINVKNTVVKISGNEWVNNQITSTHHILFLILNSSSVFFQDNTFDFSWNVPGDEKEYLDSAVGTLYPAVRLDHRDTFNFSMRQCALTGVSFIIRSMANTYIFRCSFDDVKFYDSELVFETDAKFATALIDMSNSHFERDTSWMYVNDRRMSTDLRMDRLYFVNSRGLSILPFSKVQITHSYFFNNTKRDGGAIYLEFPERDEREFGSEFHLIGTRGLSNSAKNGGFMYLKGDNSRSVIGVDEDCIVSANSADFGAAFFFSITNFTNFVLYCSVSGNHFPVHTEGGHYYYVFQNHSLPKPQFGKIFHHEFQGKVVDDRAYSISPYTFRLADQKMKLRRNSKSHCAFKKSNFLDYHCDVVINVVDLYNNPVIAFPNQASLFQIHGINISAISLKQASESAHMLLELKIVFDSRDAILKSHSIGMDLFTLDGGSTLSTKSIELIFKQCVFKGYGASTECNDVTFTLIFVFLGVLIVFLGVFSVFFCFLFTIFYMTTAQFLSEYDQMVYTPDIKKGRDKNKSEKFTMLILKFMFNCCLCCGNKVAEWSPSINREQMMTGETTHLFSSLEIENN